jgi:hypothetical protein
MARLLVGPRFDRLLPATILLGAVFIISVDTLARSAARIEIPLGVLTAVIGGPAFVWLLARTTGPVETVMTAAELSNLYGVALNVEQTPSGRFVVGTAQAAGVTGLRRPFDDPA